MNSLYSPLIPATVCLQNHIWGYLVHYKIANHCLDKEDTIISLLPQGHFKDKARMFEKH